MPRFILSAVASIALTLLLGGCAGTHKHADVPDFTEKGWSGVSPELSSATADRPIQPEGTKDGAKAEAANAAAPPPDGAAAASGPVPPPAGAPAGDSALEAAVVHGDALPPAPAKTPKARKASKVNKRGKKKAAKST